METKEIKAILRNNKKADHIKQRIFNGINPSHGSSVEKDAKLLQETAMRKNLESTLKKDKISKLINDKCLEKIRFQQISKVPNFPKESSSNVDNVYAQSNRHSLLIKPVALRPKKNTYSNMLLNESSAFNGKRSSIDLANQGPISSFDNSSIQEKDCLVFANRTNRNSKFVDRRSFYRISMSQNSTSLSSFNEKNLVNNQNLGKSSL